jgi:hypothetical protein
VGSFESTAITNLRDSPIVRSFSPNATKLFAAGLGRGQRLQAHHSGASPFDRYGAAWLYLSAGARRQ